MGLFGKIAGGLAKAYKFGSKVADVAQKVGNKVGKYGDIVANVATKAAPVLATIPGLGPELAAGAAAIAGGARLAATVGRNTDNFIGNVRRNPIAKFADATLGS
jgi:hypothetical protein